MNVLTQVTKTEERILNIAGQRMRSQFGKDIRQYVTLLQQHIIQQSKMNHVCSETGADYTLSDKQQVNLEKLISRRACFVDRNQISKHEASRNL